MPWDETAEDLAPGVESGPAGAADGEVLREIELIQGELAGQRCSLDRDHGTSMVPSTTSPRDRAPNPESDPRWGKTSPYLEERLKLARSAASRLAQEADRAERSLSGLKHDLMTIDHELGHAAHELSFERSNNLAGGPTEPGYPTDPTTPPTLPSAPLSGSYPDFTVARYNATVSALHARRLSLAWGTVVVAVGISALLLVLTLRANEPIPATWLAVLPLVWMVPVPFFMAAFRGTQRVLKENRLELPEET